MEPVLGDVVIVNYEGQYDKETGTVFHGTGIATLDNGATYEGSFRNGLFHGKGKFKWTNNVVFEGNNRINVHSSPDLRHLLL